MSTETEVLEIEEVSEDTKTEESKSLVVYNDDFNTFQHVAETLIKVCKHDPLQAEQCTMLVHYKGKCAVKNGDMKKLKPMKEAISEAGITAKIH